MRDAIGELNKKFGHMTSELFLLNAFFSCSEPVLSSRKRKFQSDFDETRKNAIHETQAEENDPYLYDIVGTMEEKLELGNQSNESATI